MVLICFRRMVMASQNRRMRRKQLRDQFLREHSELSSVDIAQRLAFVRGAEATAAGITQRNFLGPAALPEYEQLSNSVLQEPTFPPPSGPDPITARITDLLSFEGTVQSNVTAMNRLRTIRRKELKQRNTDELIVTNHDCYLNGTIIGEGYAKEVLSRAVAIVLTHEGFAKATRSVLDVLTDVTEEFLANIGQSLIANRTNSANWKQDGATPAHRTNGTLNGTVSHDRFMQYTSDVACGRFKGGFSELVAYRDQHGERISSALRDAEVMVKSKIPDWKKYVDASEKSLVRLEKYSGELGEMERIFGLFPDNVGLALTDEDSTLVPRALAEKVIAAGWPDTST